MLRHIIAVAFPVAVCDGVHVHVHMYVMDHLMGTRYKRA